MECNDDTGAMILLRIKSNIVFSYTLHHAGSGNGALRCTGGATGPGTWQDGQEVIVSSDLSERIDYNIPDLPIYARRDALSSFPDYRCPCHWHRDLEFIHVISGQMQYLVNGTIVTLEAGNGLGVNSSRLHYGFSPQQRQCWFTCVVVGPELLERLGTDTRLRCEHAFAQCMDDMLPLDRSVKWQRDALEMVDRIVDTLSSGVPAAFGRRHVDRRGGADERVFIGELLHQCVPTAARRHSARLA